MESSTQFAPPGAGKKGGRPKKADELKRQKFDVYLSAEDLAAIRDNAAAVRMPLRTFIRQAAIGRRLRARVPVADREAAEQLARIGNNLNQIAHALNSGAPASIDGDELQEVRKLCMSIGACLLDRAHVDDVESLLLSEQWRQAEADAEDEGIEIVEGGEDAE